MFTVLQNLSLRGDSAFLNTVEDNTGTSWMTQMNSTVFKLDTGAEVSTVIQDTYQSLGIQLTKPQRFCMDLHNPPEG